MNLSLSQLINVAMQGAQMNFQKFGRALPVLFVITQKEQPDIIGLPMRDAREAAAAPHVARAIIAERKAALYAYVNEAYVTDLSFARDTPPAEMAAAALGVAGRVADQQGRREAIIVIGATRHGERLQGGFDILRDSAGRGTLARRPVRTADDTAGAWAQLYEPVPRPDEYAAMIERLLREVVR